MKKLILFSNLIAGIALCILGMYMITADYSTEGATFRLVSIVVGVLLFITGVMVAVLLNIYNYKYVNTDVNELLLSENMQLTNELLLKSKAIDENDLVKENRKLTSYSIDLVNKHNELIEENKRLYAELKAQVDKQNLEID